MCEATVTKMAVTRMATPRGSIPVIFGILKAVGGGGDTIAMVGVLANRDPRTYLRPPNHSNRSNNNSCTDEIAIIRVKTTPGRATQLRTGKTTPVMFRANPERVQTASNGFERIPNGFRTDAERLPNGFRTDSERVPNAFRIQTGLGRDRSRCVLKF